MGKIISIWRFFFASYVHRKSIKMLIFHYHELMRKTKEHEGTKYLMVNDYMLDKVLDKNLMILRFWLIQMINYITLKKLHYFKDDSKFHRQIFLEEALYNE